MIARLFRSIALVSTSLSIFSLIPAAGQSARQTPAVTVTPSASTITTAQSLSVMVDVAGGNGSSTPTGTVVLTSGSYSLPPSLPYKMPALSGIYHSSVTTANLTANSGVGNATVTYVDSSGANKGTATGVAAATGDQAGNATIPFEQPLDVTQPARINVHLCIGSSTNSPDNNQLKIYFSNGPNPANGLYFSVGMNSMQLQMWGTPELTNYGSGGIPSGTCGSVFMDWLGTGPGGLDAHGNEQIWAGWIPDNPTDLQAPNNTTIPPTYAPTGLGFSAVLDAPMLSSTTEIFISDASANTLVTGVYISQGRLDGPTDGAMPVPGLFQPVVLDAGNIVPGYQSNEVWIPPTYGDPNGNPIVQTYHPNGTVADIRYGRFGVYANLFNAGYIPVAVTGDNGLGYSAWGGATYWDSPTSSGWGGPSGGQYRNAALGLVRQYLPNGNQSFRMGLSAGAADALDDEMRNPGASGIALYSGVVSLAGAWNQAGQPAPGGGTYGSFLPNLQYGWGDWYISLAANNTNLTPESSLSYWAKVSSTLTGLPLSYYNAWEYAQKGAWNAATTYNQNDIVVRPYTGTISGLAAGDPSLNLSSFARVPIQAWSEENDSTIMSPVWQTVFINGVTAAGNKDAVSNILSDCPATGGCHLSEGVFNPANNQPWSTTTSQSATLAWFNSLRSPWSTHASSSYTSAIFTLSSGAATIVIPAGSLDLGTDTLTASYTPDAASSSTYNNSAGSTPVTVTTPANPAFAITGTAVSVAPGATTGNTSTISVGPAGGFTGSVVLTAAITSSPAGAVAPPNLSFGSTSPVNIAGTTAGTATLTIGTTAAQGSTCSTAQLTRQRVPWYTGGGSILASLLLFGIPARRRGWRSTLGMLLLLFAMASGVTACGGGTTVCNAIAIASTTRGTYTVTVTGTSGAITETGTFTLTVE